MANEILKRNPTSTGNRRVFTWAGWVKINKFSSIANVIWYAASAGNSEFQIGIVASTGALNVYDYAPSAYQYQYVTSRLFRDFSNWFHLVVAVDTTQFREDDRFKIYINGVLYNGSYSTETTTGGINHNTRMNTPGEINYIGQNVVGGSNYDANCELTDLFMVDGQALTPDVFGFYKVGKGYISAGSAQATDFRPGQWVPKTPRAIKTAINNNGGFGVNGFYLPMNDSKNFGADFHGDPNSIITLNEKLPQPRVGVATTATAGIGFTDALRADPYAANLVLALPFVSGGLNSGFGDYAPSIKGSGTAKTLTNTTAVSIATTAGYYGSAANFGGSHYLTASYNSDFNFGTGDFTVEMWIYPTAVSDIRGLFAVSGGSGGNPKMVFHLNSGTPSVHYNGLTNASDIYTAASSAIPANQWTHLAYVRKGTTWTWFANGVATGTGSNTTVITFTTQPYYIGYGGEGYFAQFNGYLQDLRIYKGVAKYTGGFDVPRPYTPVGIATWRAVPDTTANNFATWNAVDRVITNGLTLSDGNLSITNGASYRAIRSTVGIPTTGKWYYEHRESTARLTNLIGSVGIATNGHAWDQNSYYDSFSGFYWGSSGLQLPINGTGTGQWISSPGIGNGDILNIAYDANSRNLWLGINGTYYTRSGNTMTGNGNPSTEVNPTGTISTTYSNLGLFPFNNAYSTTSQTNFGQNPTFSGNTTAGTFTDTNGRGLFKYQPPSGFLALCEDNLPTPAIANPGRHFRAVLYTGDGLSGRSIVGVGFTPDLVWIKSRSNAYNHGLQDSVRGIGKVLYSNLTNTEDTGSVSLTSFASNGFGLGNDSWNGSGITYVAWCWRAGAGTTSTNTNGSITSVVSVNQDAGFSIVSYTGNATVSTVGHGLGKAPDFIIVKGRTNAVDWQSYHKSVGINYTTLLNLTNASYNLSNYWGSSNPTSTNFGITGSYSGVNSNGVNYIAYCWAEIEGFSKFGSYVGNGNADGPFVYCGFKPAFILIKSSSGVDNWRMYDNARGASNGTNFSLYPNLSNIEDQANDHLDYLSNGFKLRGNNNNGSGVTYIFAAYAESPFSTANAK